jgi:hypothetical protein
MAIYSAGRRRTMIILLLTSILLITLDLRGNAVFNAARSGFGYLPRSNAGEYHPPGFTGMGRHHRVYTEREPRLQQQLTQRSDQGQHKRR